MARRNNRKQYQQRNRTMLLINVGRGSIRLQRVSHMATTYRVSVLSLITSTNENCGENVKPCSMIAIAIFSVSVGPMIIVGSTIRLIIRGASNNA